MKKALTRALCTLVCFVILFSTAAPALAEGLMIGTTVSIMVESFEIDSQTENCTIEVGDDLELMAGVSGIASSHKWEVSTDDGENWSQIATTQTYTITNAVTNTPENVPYQYRYTAKSPSGVTASTVISVLVSNDYGFRTIALRNGDTEVSSYMHDETRLVVTPLSDSVSASTVLGEELAGDCLPLMLYDVSLVNQNDEVVPYFGSVDVMFHVGSEYDSMTLRVFHLHDNIVTVYSGLVSDGVLTITVTGLSAFMVEVPAENTQTVTANVGVGGSITPSGTVNVADGSDKTFTILPDAGYEISAVTVDGIAQPFTGNSYTLSNIGVNHEVLVSFQPVTPSEVVHTVTINAPAHGTVYPSGEIKVRHGLAQTIYFYPEVTPNLYEIDKVLVNGDEVNVIGSSYTLSAVTADTQVEVSFRQGESQPPDVYKTISSSSGANGSISPMGDVSVEYGGDMYFYFIPNSGYEVEVVSIDGQATSVSGNFYHFVNVISNHTINVTYKQIVTPTQPTLPTLPTPLLTYHTISASSGRNGSISPSGSVSVADGGSQTFSFIPDANFEIDTVSIDGVATSVSGGAFTFNDVEDGHTIHVTFKKIVTPPSPTPTPTPVPTPSPTPSPTPTPTPTASPTPTPTSTPTSTSTSTSTSASTSDLDSTASPAAISTVMPSTTPSATPTPTPSYYTITAESGENGAISPDGDVSLVEGRSAYFYFIPDEGFEVDEVKVDGKNISSADSHCFDDVDTDHSIYVTFKKIDVPSEPTEYNTIAVSAEGNGSISPSGDVQVAEGGSQTFYLIADEGYEVEAIYVNGEKQDVVGGQFTVDGITGDLDLRVTFQPISADVSNDAFHSFIYRWFGRNIAPWRWLIPLIIVIALGGALWLYLLRRRR